MCSAALRRLGVSRAWAAQRSSRLTALSRSILTWAPPCGAMVDQFRAAKWISSRAPLKGRVVPVWGTPERGDAGSCRSGASRSETMFNGSGLAWGETRR